MGHHYVPRKYLQGFCEPDSDRMLWQYDKQTDRFARVSVGTAANERGFYPETVEVKLAQIVETPANKVLSKLRSNQPVSTAERAEFAFYMATMLKRVPASRKKADGLLPGVLEDTLARLREAIIQAGAIGIITPELEAKRLAELRPIVLFVVALLVSGAWIIPCAEAPVNPLSRKPRPFYRHLATRNGIAPCFEVGGASMS